MEAVVTAEVVTAEVVMSVVAVTSAVAAAISVVVMSAVFIQVPGLVYSLALHFLRLGITTLRLPTITITRQHTPNPLLYQRTMDKVLARQLQHSSLPTGITVQVQIRITPMSRHVLKGGNT